MTIPLCQIEVNKTMTNYTKYLERLSQTYKSSYLPSRNQAIDESMIRFKGRSSLKHTCLTSRFVEDTKCGCEKTRGYVCQFQVYAGKRDNITEKNLGHRVVTELTNDLIGKDYILCNDNFFNSVQLMIDLQQHRILVYGTTRWDRKNPNKRLPDGKHMTHGESSFRSARTGVVAVR